MASIPENIIDQVRDRTDIVEVISRYIPLKKTGRNYKAPCPFHHEKTPSFVVSQAKQIYHCFGCGAGGNVFNFLMKYERMEFPEAVRELAKKAGVTIPESSRPDAEKSSLAEKLYAVTDAATAFYRQNLISDKSASAARQYLAKRKIGAQAIDIFKLGYVPQSWTGLLDNLKGKGYDEPILEKSGLIIRGKEGRLFDRFRDRIMFPIFDVRGRVRGFGSRVLNETQPKYMNSPETFIYNKGSHLYGLHASWEEIRNTNSAVVVEGYLDFLTPFQCGMKNLVASLGTALTADQIRLLKRYTNNVITLFDADQAGENATLRSLDMFIEEDVKVKVVQLPKGEDPDSFVNKHGPERFRELLDKALDIFDYKLNIVSGRFNASTLEGKARIAGEMLPLISKIKNAILSSGYLKRLSEALSVSESDLKKELGRVKPDYSYRYQPLAAEPKAEKPSMAEKILAGLMLENGDFIEPVKKSLAPGDFKDSIIKKVVQALFQYYDANKIMTPSKLIDCFESDEKICACISELTATCENLMDKKKSLDDCIEWVRQCGLKERLKLLCDQIKVAQDSGDDSKVVSLVTRYNDIIKGVKT